MAKRKDRDSKIGSPGEKYHGSPSFQSWRQEFLHSLLHQLAAERIRMHGIADIVPITPHVLSRSHGRRGGPPPALLPKAFMGQPKVVAVDPPPHPRVVPALTQRA